MILKIRWDLVPVGLVIMSMSMNVVSGCYILPENMRTLCEAKNCQHGSLCRLAADGRSADCACPEACPNYGDSRGSRPVCGSDGRDYANECELRRAACAEKKNITVKYARRCADYRIPSFSESKERDSKIGILSNELTSAAPYWNYTKPSGLHYPHLHATSAAPTLPSPPPKSWNNIYSAAVRPTTSVAVQSSTTPLPSSQSTPESAILSHRSKVITSPKFSGNSYLELKRLHAATSLTLELELIPTAFDGIILYNGLNATNADGDFVSIALRAGRVEFRYDLGSGKVVLKSRGKVTTGRRVHIVAKRFMKDGTLTIQNGGQLAESEDVAGSSEGPMKMLNLHEPLYLGGHAPSANAERAQVMTRVLEANVGMATGFSGCILKLRIGRREVDLSVPDSDEITGWSRDLAECDATSIAGNGTSTDLSSSSSCSGENCLNDDRVDRSDWNRASKLLSAKSYGDGFGQVKPIESHSYSRSALGEGWSRTRGSRHRRHRRVIFKKKRHWPKIVM